MSETLTLPANEPGDVPYGEPITKSETSSPPGDTPAPEPEPKATEPEPKPEPAKPPFNEGSYQARIRQQSARLSESAKREENYERQLAEYKAKYEAPADTQQPAIPIKTQADYNRDVQAGAERLRVERAFTDDCNRIAETGTAEFADDFIPTLNNLWGIIDGMDAQGALTPAAVGLIEAAQESDNPAAILHHLGKNLDEATRIVAMSPVKMGAAVVKLSASLSAKANVLAAAAKASTKAPAPMEPVSGGARASQSLSEMSMPEYIKAREAQDKAARAR